jgi:RNA polymerase sigma factor (sigma-70 family)
VTSAVREVYPSGTPVTHQPDDAALAARAKLGDVSAFEVLLRMYEELAFRTAWLVTGSSAEAQDAVQDAFLKAHRSLGRFRDGLPFRPWLLQIVANEARNRRRAAGRRAHHEGRVALELSGPPAVDSPESHVLATETRTRLAAAVGRLARPDQVAVVGRYVLDLSVGEVAAALGVRPGAAKMRIARALERLGEELDRDA